MWPATYYWENSPYGILGRVMETSASFEARYAPSLYPTAGPKGTIDGHPFRSSFMAMGDGRHKLPVKAEIRRIIGKEVGETVTVRLGERLT